LGHRPILATEFDSAPVHPPPPPVASLGPSGIDIVGFLPRTQGGFKYLFVGIDTFTKWIEAIPMVNITQEATIKFL
jgi:transposase InsO family protein